MRENTQWKDGQNHLICQVVLILKQYGTAVQILVMLQHVQVWATAIYYPGA